jgi:hypothetical protein
MDTEDNLYTPFVLVEHPEEESSKEKGLSLVPLAHQASSHAVPCSVAVWARCVGFLGFGTSVLTIGLLLLVPNFAVVTQPPPGSPRTRRRRATIHGFQDRQLFVPHPPRRRVTLPAATKSCLARTHNPIDRHVTFVDSPTIPSSLSPLLEVLPEFPEEIQVYELCDDGASSSSSSSSALTNTPTMAVFGAASFPIGSPAQSAPASPVQLLLGIPEDRDESSPETESKSSSPQRRHRTLADKLPRVSKLFSRRKSEEMRLDEHCSSPISPKGHDDLIKPTKKPRTFSLLHHRRRASESFNSSPPVSAHSSPDGSPCLDFFPLPSPAASTDSKQSYFRRRSCDRRTKPVSPPVPRTEPYGAPYFASPPTLDSAQTSPSRGSRSPSPRSVDDHSLPDSGCSSGAPRSGRKSARVIVRRRSASADCIMRSLRTVR